MILIYIYYSIHMRKTTKGIQINIYLVQKFIKQKYLVWIFINLRSTCKILFIDVLILMNVLWFLIKLLI